MQNALMKDLLNILRNLLINLFKKMKTINNSRKLRNNQKNNQKKIIQINIYKNN